jgi:hypothetical protein
MAKVKEMRRPWANAEGGIPPPEAFHVERVTDPHENRPVVGMVRHAGQPFVADLPEGVDAGDVEMSFWQDLGHRYLVALGRVQTVAVPNDQWINAELLECLDRNTKKRGVFGWLPPVGIKQASKAGALGSFWVERDDVGDPPQVQDRSLVLLAGNLSDWGALLLGTDIGLRVVMHVRDTEVRIHGVTIASLASLRAHEAVPFDGERAAVGRAVGAAQKLVRAALGRCSDVWIDSLEHVGPDRQVLRARGTVIQGRGGQATQPRAKGPGDGTTARNWLRDFCVDLQLGGDRRPTEIMQTLRNMFVGSEARDPEAGAFLVDPASRAVRQGRHRVRPQASDDVLAEQRRPVDLGIGAGGMLRFVDEKHRVLYVSRAPSQSARRGKAGAQRRAMSGDARLRRVAVPVRSDAQGSIDAYVRGAELFDRMRAYGIDPRQYFRFAGLPLVQRVRPSMMWASDGELPNAEVRPFLAATEGKSRGRRAFRQLRLLVKYGSADPWQRTRVPLDGETGPRPRTKAQYLSLAADSRWAWHEFGHVLAFASTGELEFPFAHSAGDALAAIAADPLSSLADDAAGPARFETYPWIQIPGRSHGRSAQLGYCWCGRRNEARLNESVHQERFHHDYFGEQLMSSSLFRLYRCLGGDTRSKDAKDANGIAGALQVRLSASEYCIYLIMRAISLLGPDSLAPARTADQFVSALIEADLGTGEWVVDAAWPYEQDPCTLRRRGGRVHKVIRWAFEQQGLYATEDPVAVAEGVGRPPSMDLYIADGRCPDRRSGGGAYWPVPLGRSTDELWHASRRGLSRDGVEVKVQVRQCGAAPMPPHRVRLWYTKSEGDRWLPVGKTLSSVSGEVSDAAAAAVASFSLEPADLAQQDLWLLAAVDTDADPSNLPSGQTPPALSAWDELVELVANDNNLALAFRKGQASPA